jgi:transcriptional regulator with XRE-family HTH domain
MEPTAAPGAERCAIPSAMTDGSLGDFIRKQRAMQEMSLRQLAQVAGISNPYLSQIERGLREPSEKVLESMARALEISADTLYEQAGIATDADDEEDEPAVVAAINADPQLSGRQRQALLEVYHAFTGVPRRRRHPS